MANTTEPWTKSTLVLGQPALAQRLPRLTAVAQRAWAFVLVALAAAWMSFYLITPLPYLELESFRPTIVLHAVTGLVFVPYLASLVLGRRLPGGSALDLPLALLLAAQLLTTATSLSWRVSLEMTLTTIMAIGVFSVLSDSRVFGRWQVEAAFLIAALAATTKALWIVGGDYLDSLRLTEAVEGGVSLGDLIPPTVPKVHDVGDFRNYLGAMLSMSLPFFFVLVLRPVHRAVRVSGGVAGLAVALAIFLTLTRSTWIGAAVGVGVTGALLAMSGGWERLRRLWPETAEKRALVVVASVGVLALLGLAALYAARSLEARPLWLFRASDEPRWDALGAGAEMFRDYPLLGTGPGVYRLLYPEYSGRFLVHAIHAHNGFFQAAIDMGVPGIVSMGLLAAALVRLLLRGLGNARGDARLTLAAGAGALAAFSVFSLFDSPNEFKTALIALASVGALVVLAAREGEQGPAAPTRLEWSRRGAAALGQVAARAAIAVAMAGLLVTWAVRLDVAHYHYSNALANSSAGHLAQAREEALRAVELDPDFAAYHLALGTILGETYQETGDPLLLGDAIAELEETIRLEPRSAVAHANMALLLAEAGNRARAREEALAAIELSKSDPIATLVAGTALETANWGDEAADAYARALLLDAGLADSPFWSRTPFRRTRFQEIVGESALAFNACLQLRMVSNGLPVGGLTRSEAVEACRAQVASAPNNDGARLALAGALIESGELEEAGAHIDRVLVRKPDFGPARTTLGRWYAAKGDLAAARGQWVRAGQLGETDALVLLGDSYPAGQVPQEVVRALRRELNARYVQRDLVGILYYRYKFFRQSPVTIFLPGEWQSAVPGPIARAQDALDRWTGR